MSEERLTEELAWLDRVERYRARHDYDTGRRGDPPGPEYREPWVPSPEYLAREAVARRLYYIDQAFAYGAAAKQMVKHGDAGLARAFAKDAAFYARMAGVGAA